jgi:hypothetical protein
MYKTPGDRSLFYVTGVIHDAPRYNACTGIIHYHCIIMQYYCVPLLLHFVLVRCACAVKRMAPWHCLCAVRHIILAVRSSYLHLRL